MALPAGEPSSPVTYVGVISLFALRDEVVGVGYPRGLLHLLLRGVLHAEGDVVEESVVEKDGLLIDVTYQLAQVVYAHVFHVDTVYEHLAFLHVIIAGNQVKQRRLAAAALPHQGDGLAFWYHEVDVSQHPSLVILERNVAELYLVLKGDEGLGMLRFLDGHLRFQYLVYPFHGSQALGNVVAGLGEFLQRIDDAVEYHEVVNERGAGDGIVIEHQDSAKPQHDDNHHRAQELAHGVRHLLADIHPHDERAVSVIHPGEAFVHLFLRAESLDDAQSAQRLFHLAHGVAPELLRFDAAGFQFPAHIAHEPAEEGHEEEREERELPGDEYQRGEIGDDEDGILEQHVQGRHDAVLYLLHVSAHAGDDVPLSLFAEEAQREAVDLLVDLVAYVSHHAGADGDDGGRRQEVSPCLQESGHGQEEPYQ